METTTSTPSNQVDKTDDSFENLHPLLLENLAKHGTFQNAVYIGGDWPHSGEEVRARIKTARAYVDQYCREHKIKLPTLEFLGYLNSTGYLSEHDLPDALNLCMIDTLFFVGGLHFEYYGEMFDEKCVRVVIHIPHLKP